MVSIESSERDALIATAHEVADAARVATLSYFRSDDLVTDDKGRTGFDPVTEADRAAEIAIREVLRRRRPDDAVQGEELPPRAGTSGLTWVIDPIDGTRSFMSGAPVWGVLIALRDSRGPVLGIIDQPYIQERFTGGFGAAWVDGPMGRRCLRTRPQRDLEQATLFTTYPELETAAETAALRALSARVRLTRYGLDCYAYALIAAGQIDLVVESGLQAHDVQAPIALIEAAGGLVTDWDGNPAPQGGRIIAAANPAIHAMARAVLAAAAN